MSNDERTDILLAIGNLQGTLRQLDERHTERCEDLKAGIAALGNRLLAITEHGLPMCQIHSARMDSIERTLDLRALKPVQERERGTVQVGRWLRIAGFDAKGAALIVAVIGIIWLLWRTEQLRSRVEALPRGGDVSFAR